LKIGAGEKAKEIATKVAIPVKKRGAGKGLFTDPLIVEEPIFLPIGVAWTRR
jgi:hypothetical protein